MRIASSLRLAPATVWRASRLYYRLPTLAACTLVVVLIKQLREWLFTDLIQRAWGALMLTCGFKCNRKMTTSA